MSNSRTSAQSAAFASTDFPWKWTLEDLKRVRKNGRRVFTCFSCGGGSSMGYKLAGYEVLGNVEIDPRMMRLYRGNLKPRYSYLEDIRDFLKRDDLPGELYDLDILDGSPPCTVFSMANSSGREANWGKKKKFAEGQKEQVLDDLFFEYIKLVEKLKPRVVIAENVKGLVLKNARGYVNLILKQFENIGYEMQLFLLNAAYMGVPQVRERVFFIARKKGTYGKLRLDFHCRPITFGEVRTKKGRAFVKDNGKFERMLRHRRNGDLSIAYINKREYGKNTLGSHTIIHDDRVVMCMVASATKYRMYDGLAMTVGDMINCSTFPQDYNFMGLDVQYVTGMCVPPVMMAGIARQVYLQWFAPEDFDEELAEEMADDVPPNGIINSEGFYPRGEHP